jgi:hypothetical protein
MPAILSGSPAGRKGIIWGHFTENRTLEAVRRLPISLDSPKGAAESHLTLIVIARGVEYYCRGLVMSVEDVVKKNCGQFPRDRLVVSQFGPIHDGLIDRGILFVMALWSGPAIGSFRVLCDVMATAIDSSLLIYVVDTDDIDPEEFRKQFGEVPQGKGEVFWISGGKVQRRDHGYQKKSAEDILSGAGLLASPIVP